MAFEVLNNWGSGECSTDVSPGFYSFRAVCAAKFVLAKNCRNKLQNQLEILLGNLN